MESLQNELARLDAELARYAEAIADAGPLEAILHAVKVRQQRRDAIRAELKALATQRRADPRGAAEIRATLVKNLENWRAMARQGVAEARSLLRTLLVNRLVFTPVPRPAHLAPPTGPGRKPRFIYEFRGEGSLSAFRRVNFCKFGGGPNGTQYLLYSGISRGYTSRLAQIGSPSPL